MPVQGCVKERDMPFLKFLEDNDFVYFISLFIMMTSE